MTIQPIGAASVALYLTPDDLREHGLTPEDLTEELALRLTREAFSQAGISVEGTLEIEAYPELCGVLAAARALGNPAPEGDLVWCDGVYWLSLPADAERAACLLSEFTGPADSSPFLSTRLGEHGSTLLTGEALAVLLHYFPEKME